MQKWEYKIIEKTMTESHLNELGQQGWELLTVSSPHGGWGTVFYFRRKISN